MMHIRSKGSILEQLHAIPQVLFAAFEDVEKLMKFLFSEARSEALSAAILCAAEQRRLRLGARMPGSPCRHWMPMRQVHFYRGSRCVCMGLEVVLTTSISSN